MNKLTTEKRTDIVMALVEGNSIRATSRMTGASKVTILRLLEALGVVCGAYQIKTLRNLPCKKIQADEIWSFCHARKMNLPEEKQGKFGYGDVWTWVARIDERATTDYSGWIPLILALDYVANYPVEPPPRPGNEWVEEFFRFVCKKPQESSPQDAKSA